MNALNTIFQPLDEGKHIVIHRGRSLRDFTVKEQGGISPLLEEVRIEAFRRGMILIEYSRSEGVSYKGNNLTENEKQDINNALHSLGISPQVPHANEETEAEFVQVMRGLMSLVQASSFPTFRDGKRIAFMVVIHFAEHNAPDLSQPGFLSNEQMISIELASTLSQSIGLRKSGSYVVFSEAREGTVDNLLASLIPVLRLKQPDAAAKNRMLTALKDRYPNVMVEEDLQDEAIVNITANTPNRGIEQVYLRASRTNQPVTARMLSQKKQEDIIRMSEGTLEAVDSERIKGRKLVGRNVQRPLEILAKATDALRSGDYAAIRNIILAGAPATGKTDLATYAAMLAKIQAFVLNSPKSSLVGESERKTKLMLSILREQRGIGIIDELEMVLPMNRGGQTNDSGVTTNLMGQLQMFLSDSSLAGKVSLIATSNKPGSISAAMLSRWNVVPVLMPLREDYPAILSSLASSFLPAGDNSLLNTDLHTIADRFFAAGASPRDMKDAITTAMVFVDGQFGVRHLDYASQSIAPSADRISYMHSDLMALYHCKSSAYLPWWNTATNQPMNDYPFPDYIEEILQPNRALDRLKLQRKIEALAPLANV